MEEQNEITKKKKTDGIKKYFLGKILIIFLVVVVAAIAVISFRSKVFYDEKTTKIGFEDIGELATQVAYCTEVNVTDASREMFGVKIPFTQSKYIYSYSCCSLSQINGSMLYMFFSTLFCSFFLAPIF